MAVIYARGQKGILFKGRLKDISIPGAEEVSLENADGVYVIFEKPDGTIIPKLAETFDNDANLANGADIDWADDDPDEPSILDMVGAWEYTIAVHFKSGKYIESPYRDVFWVQ